MIAEESQFKRFLKEPTSRQDKIEQLKQYYLRFLVEDPIDGTCFDCEIIDTLTH